MLSAGAAKLGVTALCVAGAAGSYAVCSQVGVLPGASGKVSHHARHRRTHTAIVPYTAVRVARPAGRQTGPTATSTPLPRRHRQARKIDASPHGEFGNAATRGEFATASAAAAAPTFENVSNAPSPAAREFAEPSSARSEFGG
jgi:hypothetical protein